MTGSLREMAPSMRGRIMAALYLFVIACGIIAQAVIADGMIMSTDAARTAANIVADKSLYRLAYSIFIVEMIAQVAVSILWYDLLKPVDRSLARISAVIGVTGSGIKMMARTFFVAPLVVLSGASWLSAFAPAQLETLALLLVKVNAVGTQIALAFFGFEGILHGWLTFQSGFLPRWMGALSMICGLGWLTWLWPPFGAIAFMPVALLAISSVLVMTGWFFMRGVDDAKWRARAALAATSIWR